MRIPYKDVVTGGGDGAPCHNPKGNMLSGTSLPLPDGWHEKLEKLYEMRANMERAAQVAAQELNAKEGPPNHFECQFLGQAAADGVRYIKEAILLANIASEVPQRFPVDFKWSLAASFAGATESFTQTVTTDYNEVTKHGVLLPTWLLQAQRWRETIVIKENEATRTGGASVRQSEFFNCQFIGAVKNPPINGDGPLYQPGRIFDLAGERTPTEYFLAAPVRNNLWVCCGAEASWRAASRGQLGPQHFVLKDVVADRVKSGRSVTWRGSTLNELCSVVAQKPHETNVRMAVGAWHAECVRAQMDNRFVLEAGGITGFMPNPHDWHVEARRRSTDVWCLWTRGVARPQAPWQVVYMLSRIVLGALGFEK